MKPDGINLDPGINPECKNKLKNVVLQGGMDPQILLRSKDEIIKEATKYIMNFKDIPYIFNLTMVYSEIDPDKVDFLIKF